MFFDWCICINGVGLGDKLRPQKTNLALRWLWHWESGHTVLHIIWRYGKESK
jgi:hypothetical protein